MPRLTLSSEPRRLQIDDFVELTPVPVREFREETLSLPPELISQYWEKVNVKERKEEQSKTYLEFLNSQTEIKI